MAKGDFSFFFLLLDIESLGLRTVRLQREIIFSRGKKEFPQDKLPRVCVGS